MNPRIELVYAGRALLEGGKLGYSFRQVVDGKLGDERTYSKAKARTVGGVYSIEYDPKVEPPGASVYPQTMRWERAWPEKAWVAEQELRSERLEIDLDAERRRKKDEAEAKVIRKAMDPIRSAYRRSNTRGQAAIIALVMRELTRSSFDHDE